MLLAIIAINFHLLYDANMHDDTSINTDSQLDKKKSIYSMSLEQLELMLVENGFSRYSADQVFHWIYKKFIFAPEKWGNVAGPVKSFLKNHLHLSLPKIVWKKQSFDGTTKYLLGLGQGLTIETVAIPAKGRVTLCVSSQVGCAIGCTFCHTGTMGLTRNLKVEEIVGQFLVVQDTLFGGDKSQKISNIVFMGQGEPLHNFTNVKRAISLFMHPRSFAIGQRKITLSTSGLVPQIERFAEFPPVNIAISLHAAHNNTRSDLMPINRIYDLHRLFAAIRKIPLKAHRYITYEYILIDGINDRPEDVSALCDLLVKKESKINIIPFNQYPGSSFRAPSEQKIAHFKNELLNRGLITTVRVTRGPDILAACGQLKSNYESPSN